MHTTDLLGRFRSFFCNLTLLTLVTGIISFSLDAAHAAPQASPPGFYSGGKRHDLKPATDWVGIELEDSGSAALVETAFKERGLLTPDRRPVHHDRRGILVLPVQPGNKGRAEDERVKGAKRHVRVFANGKLDPIVETDEFVIRFSANVTRGEAERILAGEGAEIVRELGSYGPNGYVARVLDPEARGSIEVANALYGQANVVYSHPNFIWPMQPRFVPNDPIYSQQWHLNNDGSDGGTAGADIRAERAWEITRGNPNLIIAVLDDGVDLSHEDFATSGKFIGGWDFVGNDNDPRPGTGQNHGTCCAGLAAANGNNSLGVSGVAPNCRIMPVRMLGPNVTLEAEAAAISHAKNNGADIISNSWGPADGTGESFPCPDVISNAINDAADNGRGGKGCVILWAAGNGNESVDLDGYASHPKVICIAATMRNDTRSPYSDFGNAIDVCAPGGSQAGDMVTVDRMGSAGYATGNYNLGFNGTSAATPVAAGVAALLLSSEPDLTRAQVRQRLIDSSDFIDTANVTYDSNGHNAWYGYGRINAWRALGWMDSTVPSVTVRTPAENQVTTVMAAADGSATDSGLGVYKVNVKLRNRDDGRFWHWAYGVWTIEGTGTVQEATIADTAWSVALPNLVEGNFELQVQAEDKAGNVSGWVLRPFGLDNAVPTIAISLPAAGVSYSSLPAATGTAGDTGTGVSQVRVSLRNQTDGAWWSWSANSWGSTTFSWNDNVAIASGTTSWTRTLPSLPEGRYEVFAQAVDNANTGSAWASRALIIDFGPPVVGFAPLTNQAYIFDLGDVRGTISEPATVTFRIAEYNVGGTDRYWTGTGWDSNAGNPSTWFTAEVSGGTWKPAAGLALPRRDQTRYGHYLVEANAVDRAGGQDNKTLVLIRTAEDTTVPEVAILSPVSGQVFTNNWLPAFSGSATDPESGIAGVSMYLMRLAGSGFVYWNGTAWTVTPTELPLAVDSGSGTWQAPVSSGTAAYNLPAGNSLINGTYQIQITARNKEIPSGTRGTSVSFTVDYHPVYLWTAGSFSDWDANNNNNNWNNPENWSPYGVPGSEDIALIPSGSPDSTAGSVNVYSVRLEGGTLTTADTTIKHLQVSGGRFVSAGKMQIADNGTFIWTGGELNGGSSQSGTFNNPVSGTVIISNSNTKALYSGKFNNSGTVRWLEGNINGDESALVNGPTGVWEARAAFTLNQWPGYGAGNRGFVNFGTFRKLENVEAFNQGYFTNHGVLDVQAGVMNFYDSMTWENGSSITGAGSVRALTGCCGLTCTVKGSVNLSGTFDLYGGNTTLAGVGSIVLADAGVLNVTSGFVGGAIDISGSGKVQWTGGGFYGSNTLSATVNITGPNTKYFNRPSYTGMPVLNNAGVINWEGPGQIFGWARAGYGEQTGVLNNLPGGVFRITGEGTPFGRDGNEPVFDNQPGALLLKDGNTNEANLINFTFLNRGEIRSERGTLTFAGNLDLRSNCTLTAISPIRFNGSVTASGPVTSTGTVFLTGGWLDHARTTNDIPLSRWIGPTTIQFQGGTIGGHIVLETNVVLNICEAPSQQATKYLAPRSRLNNYGKITWSGSYPLYAWARAGYGEPPSAVTNYPGAVIEFLNDGIPFARDGDYSILHNLPGALVVKSGGTNATVLNAFVLDNAGEIRSATNVLEFNDRTLLRHGGRFSGAGLTRFTGGTHTVFGTNYIDGTTLQLENGTVSGDPGSTGTLATAGTGLFQWTGGFIADQLTWASGSSVQIAGPATKTFDSGAIVNNYAKVEWLGSGSVWNRARPGYGENPATWNNFGGAVLEAKNDSGFILEGYASTFNNFAGAIVRKSGGTGTNATVFDWIFNNSGLVQAEVDRLELAGGGLDSGRFLAGSSAARIRFTRGTHTLAGARFEGAGKFQVDGATVSTSGDLFFDHAALEVLSGVLEGTGNLTGFPMLNWTGGMLGGTQNFKPGTVLNVSGASTKYLASLTVINNEGQINWSGPGDICAWARGGYAEYPSTINNLPGGKFVFLTDGQPFTRNGEYSRFNNYPGALLTKAGGTNETAMHSFILENRGQVSATLGTLAFVDYANLWDGSSLDGASLVRFAGNITASNAVVAKGTIRLDAGSFTALTDSSGTNATILLGTNTFQWMGGALSGKLTLSSNVVMVVTDPGTNGVTKHLGSLTELNNLGQINWSGAGQILAWARAGYNEYPSTINNLPGGVFRLLNDGTPFARNGDYSRFKNAAGALLVKTGGTNEAQIDSFIIENRGTISAASGGLAFTDIANFWDGSVLNAAGSIRFAGSITASNAVYANGQFRMNAGSFTGLANAPGAVGTLWLGTNTFEWVGGTMYGKLTVGSSVTINIAEPGNKFLGSQTELNNLGLISWSGPGQIYGWARGGYNEYPSTINNLPGGVFRLLNDGTPFVRDGDYSNFTNHPGALLIKAGGNNSSVVNGFRFVNAGELRAQTGTLDYNDLSQFNPGGSLSGAGLHLVSGGNHLLKGGTRLDALLRVTGGYVKGVVGSGAALQHGTGSLEWTGGTLGGELEFGSGLSALLAGSGTKALASAALLHNRGTVRWTGTGDIWSPARPGYAESPAAIANETGAQFIVETDAGFRTWGDPNVFTNQPGALVVKTNSTGGTACDWRFHNHGTVQVVSGTLGLNANSGLASDGVIEVALGGTMPGTGYGRLSMPGAVTLEGILRVVPRDGFQPASGQTFAVVTYGSATGQFGTQLPPLPFGYQWQTRYEPTQIVLEMQQAPAAVQPVLSATGQFRFDLVGPPASKYIVEASTNMVDWVGIWTNNAFTGQAQFTDPNSPAIPGRFYRLRVEK